MVRKAIEASFAPLGGLESIITDADRVLLKLWCAHRSAAARPGSLAVILCSRFLETPQVGTTAR
jgi:uncharacterized protein (DUF362 family)